MCTVLEVVDFNVACYLNYLNNLFLHCVGAVNQYYSEIHGFNLA